VLSSTGARRIPLRETKAPKANAEHVDAAASHTLTAFFLSSGILYRNVRGARLLNINGTSMNGFSGACAASFVTMNGNKKSE